MNSFDLNFATAIGDLHVDPNSCGTKVRVGVWRNRTDPRGHRRGDLSQTEAETGLGFHPLVGMQIGA